MEVGLEPSCVIVCPTQSIVAGDLDDPTSRITTMLGRHGMQHAPPNRAPIRKCSTRVRRRLRSTRSEVLVDGLMWADQRSGRRAVTTGAIGASGSGAVACSAYQTDHVMTGTDKVTAYRMTKAISAGVIAVAALAVFANHAGERATIGVAPPLVASFPLARPRSWSPTSSNLAVSTTSPSSRSGGPGSYAGAFAMLTHGALAALWLADGLLEGQLSGNCGPPASTSS